MEENKNYKNKHCIDCNQSLGLVYKTTKRCRSCRDDHIENYFQESRTKRLKESHSRFDEIKTLEGETWNFINGYDGIYEISSLGRVRARFRRGGGGLVRIQKNSMGYPVVYLKKSVNHPVRCHLIHRLVAEHFIPNPNHKKVVDHIDRNPLNHSLDNLRWVSYSENSLNSKRCDRAGTLKWKKNKNGSITYSVSCKSETFRSRHIVQAIKFLFNRNKHLMSHIIKEPLP